MADSTHLRVLMQGVEFWNQWRRENPEVAPDLSQADLSWEDLRGADLSGANLREANLIRTDLNRANLSGADLSGSDLSGAQGLTREQILEAQGIETARVGDQRGSPQHRSGLLSKRPAWRYTILLLTASLGFTGWLTLAEKERPQATTKAPALTLYIPPELGTTEPPPNHARPGDRKPARNQQSAYLTALTLAKRENALRIFAASDVKPTYKVFELSNPNRVAIDLPGLTLSIAREARILDVTHTLVKRVRIEQHRLEPPLVRLVLDVSSFPSLAVTPRPDGLEIVASSSPAGRS